VFQWAVSNQTLEHRDLELTFNTKCLANRVTENDRNAYTASIRDLIDLDAVVVVSSSNRNVSPYFLPVSNSIFRTVGMIRMETLVPSLQPTQHSLQVNFR